MKAAEWIDRVKVAKGWESDYRVGKELGFSRAVVSNYRTKARATLDDDNATKVAAAIGIPAEAVLVDQYVERSKSDSALAALRRLREMFSVYYV